MTAILVIVGSVLLGSIPFGLLLTRAAGLGDIRAIGSGSIGATNVLRTGRKDIAALTVLLDAAKGAAAVLLALHFAGPAYAALSGVAAVAGHCFSFWLRGKGGKGIATGFGVLLAFAWPATLACAALWLLTALLTRRSSAAGLTAALAAPIALYLTRPEPYPIATLAISALIFFKHRPNITRLLNGTEPRIGQKS